MSNSLTSFHTHASRKALKFGEVVSLTVRSELRVHVIPELVEGAGSLCEIAPPRLFFLFTHPE